MIVIVIVIVIMIGATTTFSPGFTDLLEFIATIGNLSKYEGNCEELFFVPECSVGRGVLAVAFVVGVMSCEVWGALCLMNFKT